MVFDSNIGTEKRKKRAESFVTAAAEIWLEQGLDGFSMAQVAKKANSSVGNLYFYFPDRDTLLCTVLSQLTEDFRTCVGTAMREQGRIHTRLARALYRGIDFFIGRPELCKLCFGAQLPPAVDRFLGAILAERLTPFLRSRPGMPYAHSFASVVWKASIRDTLRAVMAGDLGADPLLLAASLIRWNFQALGLSKPAVQRVIARLSLIRD